jgi:Tfp pilus assembly protein PilP
MKKIIIMCLMLVIATGTFAQSAPSAGLTDSDVTSFSKNYGTIKAELEKLGIDVQDTDSVADAKNAEAKVNSILNKNGISGNNPVNKLKAIAFGYAVEKYEATMAEDPQTAQIIRSMGVDPIANVRKEVAPEDCKVVKKHLNELQKAFDDDDFPATSSSDQSSTDSYDMAALQELQKKYANLDYEDPDEKAKKEVLKKYDVKRKFNVVKDGSGEEWIIIQPSEITFANSTEAELYAENYAGVSGKWCMSSSCGYLGSHSNNKPFYTWGSDGILCYTKFPIDFDSCAPDKVIYNEDVTPDLAKKAVLQMYKY